MDRRVTLPMFVVHGLISSIASIYLSEGMGPTTEIAWMRSTCSPQMSSFADQTQNLRGREWIGAAPKPHLSIQGGLPVDTSLGACEHRNSTPVGPAKDTGSGSRQTAHGFRFLGQAADFPSPGTAAEPRPGRRAARSGMKSSRQSRGKQQGPGDA